jgi:hypothetical protein
MANMADCENNVIFFLIWVIVGTWNDERSKKKIIILKIVSITDIKSKKITSLVRIT